MTNNNDAAARQAPAGGKLDAALAWAARGFRCFPLQENTKLPLDQGWTISATTDPDVIRAIWTDPVVGAARDYNIGVLTSDLIAVDVDVKAGKPGLVTMLRLGLEFDTLTTRTPTGGYHLIFNGIGREVGNAPLGPGLDVRARHGYLLAPGSTIDNVPYTIEIDEPVADFPVELRPLLKAPRSRRDASGVSVELDQPEAVELAAHWLRREALIATQGENGDLQTFKTACRVRDFGVSEEVALDLMLDHWNDRCEPPWSVHEVRLKVENAYRYATGVAGSASPAALFDGVVHVPQFDQEAPAHIEGALPAETLPIVNGADFAARSLRPRPWLVPGMIPDRTVTLLAGDGGTGKSLLAQQLAAAVSTGGNWLGAALVQGRAIYLSAEDDLDEVHRRLVDIAEADGLALDDLTDLHVVPLAGLDAVLASPRSHSDILERTPLWNQLVATVKAIRPQLLVIDNLADAFAGNENARPQARQFIGMLRGLAIENELAVLVISHPSLTGMANGAGTSGSTAWSNSVRSRLYLERVKAAENAEPDPDLRVLRTMKANYAQVGIETLMRWEQGSFRLVESTGASQLDRAAAAAKAERVFLALLERFRRCGRDVSPKPSRAFAPIVFAKQPDAEGCSRAALEGAMERLLARNEIRIEKHGPPSRSYSRLTVS